MHKALGCPDDIEVIIDPAAWSVERTIAQGRLDRSVLQEYEMAAKALGAKWFQPSPAYNADLFCWVPKRYMMNRQMFIGKHLKWMRWEIERLTYQRQAKGIIAGDKSLPEKPVDKDDHLVSCLRYLCNSRPEMLNEPPEFILRDETYWVKKDLERARSDQRDAVGSGSLGSEW